MGDDSAPDELMRICKIWDADYPWDIRVEKVADSLAAAGHSVHLVCRNQRRRVRREQCGTFTVHRLPSLPVEFGPLHTVANFPHPFNPVWLSAIAGVIRTSGADLILVRDILLAVPAILVAHRYRIPVVLDMAENYPAMLQDRLRYTPTGPLGRLIRQPAFARFIERVAIRRVDHIIVVVEESRDRLVQAGVASQRLSIVCNTPRLEQWTPSAHSDISPPVSERMTAVYLGNLDGSRGIDVAIRAIRHLKDGGHLIDLYVIGNGPNIHGLRKLVVDLGLDEHVTITGYLSFRDVQSLIARAHVGLIPHYGTEAWSTTIPNKLFDYMLLSLPVIVSEVRPMARIVRATGCGEVFRDRDPDDLARCITVLTDAEQRRRAGENGRRAVLERYRWDHDGAILVDTVERVARASVETARPS
jgi:glycosyltransferase involved in cell wall biosynthesis